MGDGGGGGPFARPERVGSGQQQQQQQPPALLGWLTACDVSHFRLDSTEHGVPPFLSLPPFSATQLETRALAVATAMQPFASHAAIHSLT